MPRKSPAFSFYPDSWIGGTMRMTPPQRAAYMDLLSNQWLEGGFDFATALLVARGVSESDVRTVLSQKFVLQDGLYRNERLEEERQKQQEKRMAGSKGGSKRQANRVANAKQNGSKTQSKPPSKSLHSDSVSDSVSDLVLDSESTHTPSGDPPVIPEGLEEAWEKWTQHVMQKFGRHIGSVEAETVLMDLAGRGVEKAIRDIDFTIRVSEKGNRILDSDNDFEKKKSGKQSKELAW